MQEKNELFVHQEVLLRHLTCAQLGLSKEWLTPKERGEEEVEFNQGRKKTSGSTLNIDG